MIVIAGFVAFVVIAVWMQRQAVAWSRLFFRIWLIGAGLWWLAMGLGVGSMQHPGIGLILALVVTPPVLVGILGAMFGWAFRGMARR